MYLISSRWRKPKGRMTKRRRASSLNAKKRWGKNNSNSDTVNDISTATSSESSTAIGLLDSNNENVPVRDPNVEIGVMLQSNGRTPIGDNSLDKFAHHPYALTSPNPTPNYAAIFGIAAAATEIPPYVNGTRPTAPSAAQINNQNEATTTT